MLLWVWFERSINKISGFLFLFYPNHFFFDEITSQKQDYSFRIFFFHGRCVFLLVRSVVMLLSAPEQALTAAKPRCTVGQDGSHSPVSSCSCMGEPGALSPSLAISGSATLGWARGRDSVGCSQPGCAVVEGAGLALLHSAPPLWRGLAGCCRIPRIEADAFPQILISLRERSCFGILYQSHTLFSGLSEESPVKAGLLRSSHGFFVAFLFSRSESKKQCARGYTKTSMV